MPSNRGGRAGIGQRYVADAHAIAWFVTADRHMSDMAREALQNVGPQGPKVLVPTIVMAELAWLAEKRRVRVGVAELFGYVGATEGWEVVPFGLSVLDEFVSVGPGLEMHDRVIVATARVHNAAVVTSDADITASGLVQTIW